MSLGEKVKDLREKKGMNQKQLAEASNITQATISRIESGWVKELKSGALRRLAEALGVTVDFLVDRTEELAPIDIISSDTTIRDMLTGYMKLSSERRGQVIDFMSFLERQEERQRRPRRPHFAGVRKSRRLRRRYPSSRLGSRLGMHRSSRGKPVKEVRKRA
jgi:transcriptional regulator with XRE-family HTH domain